MKTDGDENGTPMTPRSFLTHLAESFVASIIPSILVGTVVAYTSIKILEDHEIATQKHFANLDRQIETQQGNIYRHEADLAKLQIQGSADREQSKLQIEEIRRVLAEIKELTRQNRSDHR